MDFESLTPTQQVIVALDDYVHQIKIHGSVNATRYTEIYKVISNAVLTGKVDMDTALARRNEIIDSLPYLHKQQFAHVSHYLDLDIDF